MAAGITAPAREARDRLLFLGNGTLAAHRHDATPRPATVMSILGHWERDLDGDTVWLSPGIAEYLQGQAVAATVETARFREAIHSRDRETVLLAERRAIDTAQPQTVYFTLASHNGALRPVCQVLRVVHEAGGTRRRLHATLELVITPAPAPEHAAALLHALEQASPEGIGVVDDDGKVVEFNGRLLQITSLDAGKLRAPGGSRLLALEDQAKDRRAAADMADAALADPYYVGQDELALRDGRTVERYTAPLRTESGRRLGRVWHIRDITETQRKAESLRLLADANSLLVSSLEPQEILESLARLLVERIADWCFVGPLSPDSPVAVTPVVVTGEGDSAHAARDIAESWARGLVVTPPAGQLFFQPLAAGETLFFPEIKPDTFDTMLDSIARDYFRVMGLRSGIVVPLRTDKALIGILGVGTAHSGRRYDEEDLRLVETFALSASLAAANAQRFGEMHRITQELQRANQAKDELIGIVSHELRTPLTIIQGGAATLRGWGKQLADAEKDALLADMEDASHRLQLMVENMLLLARAELTRDVVAEPVLGHRAIRRAVEAFSQRHPARVITLDLDETPPLAAQPTFLEEVVTNLLSNADRYSPPEQPIEVSLESGPGGAVVHIRDRGIGITPEEAAAAFEPFYRSARTQLYMGAGLGLPACKRMVEAMGGEIWIRPRSGGGAEAGFTIPLYQEDET